jgi:hypothetical protein
MIRHGEPPYLECSTKGDPRFSAFRAHLINHNFNTIEQIYQSSKEFPPGSDVDMFGHMINWRHAKGKRCLNQEEVTQLYDNLWREYLKQSPDLIDILVKATGLSDMFGQPGSCCQATSLWKLREEYMRTRSL